MLGQPVILMRCLAGQCLATRHILVNPTTATTIVQSQLGQQSARGMRLYRERLLRSMHWRGRSFDRVKYNQFKRSQHQEWNYRSEIFAFSRRLQENLSEDTLRCLFANPSYVEGVRDNQVKYNLPEMNIQSNSELVQRGDELLDHCVKRYLRHMFDRMPEDGIISITNFLKSEPVLADIAKWFGCKDIILTKEWPPSSETMANTVRALLGGIEADLGIDRVQRFVVDMIISYLNDKDLLDDVWNIPEPKEKLNKILANSGLPAYEPRLLFQTGIRTIEACHIVGLYVQQNLIGSSAGETIAIAEECAALDALQRLFDLGDSRRPFVYGEASEKINYEAHANEHPYMRDWQFKL